jgi:tripartite-type tricarboxylate transporter receptor subunit TctC
VIPSLTRNAVRGCCVIAAGLLVLAAQAQPAWKPSRAVTIIVPYAPGGGTDVTARAIAQQLSTQWGQPVVVENAPGAEGVIGTRRAIKAEADGHTLLIQVPGIALTPHMPGTKGIQLLDKLEPVTNAAQAAGALMVNGKITARTAEEFFEYCRKAAKPCSIATGETMGRLFVRFMGSEAKLPNLINASYRGTTALVPDLVAGNVDAALTSITAVLPHHQSQAVRILTFLGPKRSPMLPEVPSAIEAGIGHLTTLNWTGVFLRKGTSLEIRNAIASSIAQAVKVDSVRSILDTAGLEPVGNTPAEFAEQIAALERKLGELIVRFPIE